MNCRKICDSYRRSIVPFWNLWVIVGLKLADRSVSVNLLKIVPFWNILEKQNFYIQLLLSDKTFQSANNTMIYN